MARRVCTFVTLVCLASSLVAAVKIRPTEESELPVLPVPLWPSPTDFTFGSTTLPVVSIDFAFNIASPSSDLESSISRFVPLIFPHASFSFVPSALSAISITVKNPGAPLQYGVDESYTLQVPSSGADGATAVIVAATNFGAYHALQTFSQLVHFNFTSKSYAIAATPISIFDVPRFSHRGLLVDTARHFQPTSSLKSIIDSLTYAKLNVLHWHAVDTQSFPFEFSAFPHLWDGAFSDDEKYTKADMAEVVEYARARGVRVIVEFDTPGHAGSWCVGYPGICPSPTCTQPLNPAANLTWTVLQSIFSEVTGNGVRQGTFFDDFIHLGGDEVDTTCWSQTPAVQQWMTANSLTPDQTYAYFVNRTSSIVLAHGRDPIQWEEVFNHFGSKLDLRSVVHCWLPLSSQCVERATAAGFRTLVSNTDFWYLDHLETTWQQMYTNEPTASVTDPKQQSLVIGGEGGMWGETVDTSDLQQTVWPRLAAIAERLWSPQNVVDIADAEKRLHQFRCLLNRRGVAAAPVNNPIARTGPIGPGGCLTQ